MAGELHSPTQSRTNHVRLAFPIDGPSLSMVISDCIETRNIPVLELPLGHIQAIDIEGIIALVICSKALRMIHVKDLDTALCLSATNR